MNVSAAFEANTEATQPGMRALNDPAIFARATAVFGAALGNDRLDTALERRVNATPPLSDTAGNARISAAIED